MNIDQMKSEWQEYNVKLSLSHRLNEQLIMSMLKERSRSRVAKIRRDNTVYMVIMLATLVFLGGVFAGNPFDFKYTLQFVPYGVLAIGVSMAIVSLFTSLHSFSVDISNENLDSFLKKTIEEYAKSREMERWFGILIVSAGILTAFSFLPKKLEHKELWRALAETALMIVMTLVIYLTAFKLGAFKNRKREGFENDLKELNELKGLSAELRDS